jgi:uncharacterized protein involved in outer membrane biogenesis
MKVWKSPVFYFGILLVVAIAGLLSAPYVIDWNTYRADLEAYGKKLTGRDVKIDGPVTVQLFPWPKLTARTVSIANPAGLETPEFAHADRIVVRMTLAGLARGTFDVESIDIEGPVIRFERLATGEGNWQFSPASDLIKSDLLSRVSLDQIKLSDGTVYFTDRRRHETHRLDDLNAAVNSPGVTGPWRLRAQALHDDRAVEIAMTTGVWEPGQPFRFGLKVGAASGSGLVFAFDGASHAGNAKGTLRIEPAAAEGNKAGTQTQSTAVVLTANVEASFDRMKFDKIEVAPQDARRGGIIATGSAELKLGPHIDAKADLKSAMLDLDQIAGSGSRALLRQAGSIELAESLLKALPGALSFKGSLAVTALKTDGETLDNVLLAVEAGGGALRVKELSSGLPGRSRMLFKGVYFPGEQGAEIAGDLAVESNDLRQLTQWLWPDARQQVASIWTGNRGRLKLQTDVSMTAQRLRLTKARYELDGEKGSAELSVTPAGRGAVDLRVDADRADLDTYIPQGVTALSAAATQGFGQLVTMVLPRADAPDLRLTLQTAQMLLNGVTATDVVLDLASGANGLDLRALEIGSVGGARLSATGLILDSGKGADGSIGLEVKAENPRELLRLLGLVQDAAYPAWAANLGPAEAKGTLGVKPADSGSALDFNIEGKAGVFGFNAKGAVGAAMDISGEAMLTSPNSSALAGLLDLMEPSPDGLAASLEIKAAGTGKDGFMADAALKMFGARLDYRGTFNPLAEGFGLGGKLAVRSTESSLLLQASGLPVSQLPDGVLVVDAGVASTAAGWAITDLAGRLDGAQFSGAFDVSSSRHVTGQFEMSALPLVDVLAPVFLNWSGAVPDLETAFAARLPLGLTGEIWIRPKILHVHQNFAARDAEIGIVVKPDEINLALFGKDEIGRGAQIELVSKGTDSSRKLSGRVTIPVELSTQLLLAGGKPAAEGSGAFDVKFEAEGRSAGGALAGLRGSGAFGFENFRLLGLSPRAFASALAEAKDGTGVTAAFEALRGGEGMSFGKINGTITIANGEVGFLPFSLKTPEADVTVKTVAELALGEIDSDVTVALKAVDGLPAMSFSYAGPPAALARSEDNAEISTKLGVAIMQRGIDELERLQLEQRRLAEQEEKQRIEDEARLAAYYAQRDELLLRKRELKVHSEMRVIESERLRLLIETERAANTEINKVEIKQRQREIKLHRRLAKLSTAVPPQKPKAVTAKPAKPAAQGPLVLANPKDAPIVFSAPPGESPSQ